MVVSAALNPKSIRILMRLAAGALFPCAMVFNSVVNLCALHLGYFLKVFHLFFASKVHPVEG